LPSPIRAWRALADDPHLADGLNIHNGMVTNRAVAEALHLPFVPIQQALTR